MIKKFMIILILTFFMVSAVSASDINETVSIDYAEIQIPDIIEVNDLELEELKSDDVVENDVISEEDIAPITYNCADNDSYIINSQENYDEIEKHQYNETYIESLINGTLNNNTEFDLNSSKIVSHYIFNDFFKIYEVFICINLDSTFKTIDLGATLSKFRDIDKFKILTHEDLIFYNDYCSMLTHDVDKNVLISNDKLHTKFAFSIDNLIVGGADSFIYNILNPNFSNFFSLSSFQTFSNFVQIFINFNYYEYSFFPSKTIE